jgi:hypothetical protein
MNQTDVSTSAGEDDSFSSPLSPGNASPHYMALEGSMQVGQLPCSLLENVPTVGLDPRSHSPLPKNLTCSMSCLDRRSLEHDFLPALLVGYHAGSHVSIPPRYGHDLAPHQHQDRTGTLLDNVSEASQECWDPDLAHLAKPSPGYNDHATQEKVNSIVNYMPHKDDPKESSQVDHWSFLGVRPISSPNLVLSHTHCVGYAIPSLENANANIRLAIQPPDSTAQHGISCNLAANEYASLFIEPLGRQQEFPVALHPASPRQRLHSGLDSFSGTRTSLRSSKSLPEGTQFAWNSRTGEQVVKSRTRRSLSEEEKASTKEVRRLGGSCDPCKLGHRKVTLHDAFV